MNQEKRRRDSEEEGEEKGKSSLSFFKAYEKKTESNSAHNGTRNITGAPETRGVDQSFEQQRLVTIQTLPILRQAMGCKGKDLGRQAAHGNGRKYQKPAVVDDVLQTPLALLCLPADPGVAWGHFPGGAGKQQAAEPASRKLVRSDKVSQVGAERNAVAEIVVAVDELVEDGAEGLIAGLNQVEGQGLELAGTADDVRLSIVFGSRVKPETCV